MLLIRQTMTCLFVAVAALAATVNDTLAQPIPLNEAAQDPFNRGLLAAREQDWKVAIQLFLEAHRADGKSQQIWFNLGLAHSKLPGHELRAIAFLRAYLLAAPNAQNADAVRQLVRSLEVSFESRMAKTLDQLENLLLASRGNFFSSGIEKLADVRNYFGDTEAATRLLKRALGSNFEYPSSLATSLAAAGKLEEAKKVANNWFTGEMLEYFLEADDIEGAWRVLESDTRGNDGEYRSTNWINIFCWAYDARDNGSLERLLSIPAKKEGNIVDKVGLLVLLGRIERARELANAISNQAYRSIADRLLLAKPDYSTLGACSVRSWAKSGPRRIAFLRNVGVHGVFYWDRPGANPNKSDETQLDELMKRALLNENATQAAENLGYFISSVLVDIASIYRRTRGPYFR